MVRLTLSFIIAMGVSRAGAFVKASRILKTVCPVDIYSSRWGVVPRPTREHIVPKKFLSSSAGADLNNIFVCTSVMNSKRGLRRFDTIHVNEKGVIVLDGSTSEVIGNGDGSMFDPRDVCLMAQNRFYPPSHARGAIARVCMYMGQTYPSFEKNIFEHVLDVNTMLLWDKMYPIQEWEIERARNIRKLGYPRNKFVLLHEYHDYKPSRTTRNDRGRDDRGVRHK